MIDIPYSFRQLIREPQQMARQSQELCFRQQVIYSSRGTQERVHIQRIYFLDKLFIVHEESRSVYIYNASTFNYIIVVHITELEDPRDIVSCNYNQSIYIFEEDCGGKPFRIFRLDTRGHVIRQWVIGKGYGTMSLTYDSNVIVAFNDRTALKEYLCKWTTTSGIGDTYGRRCPGF